MLVSPAGNGNGDGDGNNAAPDAKENCVLTFRQRGPEREASGEGRFPAAASPAGVFPPRNGQVAN